MCAQKKPLSSQTAVNHYANKHNQTYETRYKMGELCWCLIMRNFLLPMLLMELYAINKTGVNLAPLRKVTPDFDICRLRSRQVS